MMNILRKYVRNIIRESFQSHSFEPVIGDDVENINPGCKHFGSKGTVIRVEVLPKESGKTITYKVINQGKFFNPGSILTKTLDQLAPLVNK
jgi:hypothetical protein